MTKTTSALVSPPAFEIRTDPVPGEVEVPLSRLWIEDAECRNLLCGRVVRRTKTTVRMALTTDEARVIRNFASVDWYKYQWSPTSMHSGVEGRAARRIMQKIDGVRGWEWLWID